MRKVMVFNSVSLDGYFTDANSDMSWAHKNDPEWTAFTSGNAKGGAVLLFGRVTYDMMAGWWPSPQAMQIMPAVAEQMNQLQKVVFSRTLEKAEWSNTTLIRSDPATAVRTMKSEPGLDMVIMGSGTIVAQLTQEGLIDEYQIVVNPIVLGSGRTMFDGVKARPLLKQVKARSFSNGNVVLYYEQGA